MRLRTKVITLFMILCTATALMTLAITKGLVSLVVFGFIAVVVCWCFVGIYSKDREKVLGHLYPWVKYKVVSMLICIIIVASVVALPKLMYPEQMEALDDNFVTLKEVTGTTTELSEVLNEDLIKIAGVSPVTKSMFNDGVILLLTMERIEDIAYASNAVKARIKWTEDGYVLKGEADKLANTLKEMKRRSEDTDYALVLGQFDILSRTDYVKAYREITTVTSWYLDTAIDDLSSEEVDEKKSEANLKVVIKEISDRASVVIHNTDTNNILINIWVIVHVIQLVAAMKIIASIIETALYYIFLKYYRKKGYV